MDAISESRLGEVHPALATRIHQMALMLEVTGVPIRVTQGLRSWSQQDTLWKQGRDADGNIIPGAAVVTKAPPGHSWHNFGLAVDVVPEDHADGQIDWNTSHPVWAHIVKAGESVGLTAGAEFRTFPDYPHFQLTGRFPATPTEEVRQLFLDGGMSAVWEEAKIT